jgi:uncharacterized protein
VSAGSRRDAFFRRIVALRAPILAVYAVLVPIAAVLAARIPAEGAVSSLVMPDDPDFAATRAFHRVFPEGQDVFLVLETREPFAPDAVAAAEAIAGAIRRVKDVTVVSAFDVFRQARPAAAAGPGAAEAFRRFATGAGFFRKQGLWGDAFLGLVVAFPADGAAARDATLAAIDAALDAAPRGPITRIRKVGAPYVEAWIERQTGQSSVRWFPVFGLFVVVIVLFLYRSWRTLAALLLALAAAVALAVGAGKVLGFSFTVVSALVPLTVMVTALASLVYVHSRFVDQPEGVDVQAHQLFALANKLLPVTASTVAAVLGFAALAISPIRPIREMGIWTAAGLALSWVVVFTLFPALQRTLRTPTGRAVATRTALYDRVAAALPGATWRWRWPLVGGALALAAAGAIALVGWPGRLAPMRVGVDALDYVPADEPVHEDLAWFERHVSGLDLARAWVRTPPGAATDPELLRGLDRFAAEVEALPRVSLVVGPTTFLRLRRYVAGGGEALPSDPAGFAAATADLEQLLLAQPDLRAFLDAGTLSNAQVMVVFRGGDAAGYQAMSGALRAAWARAGAAVPALREATMEVVGESLLQAKIGASLVPTLSESFALTAALIFLAFLAVFRSASARLLAMIPSVFAILVTFLGMRVAGGALNVATILIATTVLGTTENDQIHFFHHLHEGEGPGGLDGALRHALRVSGRAILFATLINAAGFLALAMSSFPPIRQFGLVTSAAFLLGMLADFTALPAALWLVRRERPREAAAPEPRG